MDIKKIKELLLEYPDGDITEQEKTTVERTIHESREHLEFYKASQRTWRLMDKGHGIEPSTDYVSRFWNRVAEEESKRANWLTGILDVFRLSPGWSAAAVVIIAVFASFLYFDTPENAESLNTAKNDTQPPKTAVVASSNEDLQNMLDAERVALNEPLESHHAFGPLEVKPDIIKGETEFESAFNSFIRPVNFGDID